MYGGRVGQRIFGPSVDATYCALTEDTMLTKSSMDKYDIQYYARLWDDGLVVGKTYKLVHDFFCKVQEMVRSVYSVKCEQISPTCVTMLQVDIFAERGRFRCVPRFKPLSLGPALSVSSAHSAYLVAAGGYEKF